MIAPSPSAHPLGTLPAREGQQLALRAVPLPSRFERLRAWRDRQRRRRKILAATQGADALVVSHAKSGRTWLRVMISHVYHLRFGVPERQVINYDNFHRLNAAIPKLFFMGASNDGAEGIRRWTEQVSAKQAVILLVRDPRDVVVSFYHHLAHRATDKERSRKGLPQGFDLTSIPLYDFARDERFGLPRIIAFMNIWAAVLARHPRTLVVRYEDMRAHPQDTLASVMNFLDGEADPSVIERATAFASFDSLRRLEREGFFESERLRPGRAGGEASFKVREGRVGGYRDLFSEAERVVLDRFVETHLTATFGYHQTAVDSVPSTG